MRRDEKLGDVRIPSFKAHCMMEELRRAHRDVFERIDHWTWDGSAMIVLYLDDGSVWTYRHETIGRGNPLSLPKVEKCLKSQSLRWKR